MSNLSKKGTVYVVIPTYNRVELTIKCISLLFEQTYPDINIIVSDGNSSDKTVDIISEKYPAVVVLSSKQNLWWGGAMSKGIDYVLSQSSSNNDYLLMMNNDTEFSSQFVEILVNSSRQNCAVVGSLILDINSPLSILDAGVNIDWSDYRFNIKKTLLPGEKAHMSVDTLPGRGTIIPIDIVRSVGNINTRKFPHYIADYEYFCRIKNMGYTLCVTYETEIFAHHNKTGYVKLKNQNYYQKMYSMLSRRSKSNIFDQYNFIDIVAPDEFKTYLKRRLLPSKIRKIINYFE